MAEPQKLLKPKYGSPGRARTADPVINSHLLYRLSYRGITPKKQAARGSQGGV